MIYLINPDNTCSFTGYRPEKLPWRDNESAPECAVIKNRIYEAAAGLYDRGIIHYICGMARGCDTYFFEEILRLKNSHPEITIEAAIPFRGQADSWPPEDRERYFRLLSLCDQKTVLQDEYTPNCMTKRNRYMVDNSSVLIAVYDGISGGTMQTVNYAAKKGLEIISLSP